MDTKVGIGQTEVSIGRHLWCSDSPGVHCDNVINESYPGSPGMNRLFHTRCMINMLLYCFSVIRRVS